MAVKIDYLTQRALKIAMRRALNNGHHGLIGAEYLLYGVMRVTEQESLEIRVRGYFGEITANVVMSRIVLIHPHSDGSDPVVFSECFSETLRSALGHLETFGSERLILEHLMLALFEIEDDTVVASAILNRLYADRLTTVDKLRESLAVGS